MSEEIKDIVIEPEFDMADGKTWRRDRFENDRYHGDYLVSASGRGVGRCFLFVEHPLELHTYAWDVLQKLGLQAGRFTVRVPIKNELFYMETLPKVLVMNGESLSDETADQ